MSFIFNLKLIFLQPAATLIVIGGREEIRIIALTLILTSLCMLFDVDPHTCIMTDRQERFDRKMSELKILWKQIHLHLGEVS